MHNSQCIPVHAKQSTTDLPGALGEPQYPTLLAMQRLLFPIGQFRTILWMANGSFKPPIFASLTAGARWIPAFPHLRQASCEYRIDVISRRIFDAGTLDDFAVARNLFAYNFGGPFGRRGKRFRALPVH